MLDEPLASLDATLSRQLVGELRQIIKQVGLMAIYVTHNQQEAFAIADRIGIMNAGKIEQVNTAQELYRRPKTLFIARFLGFENILPIQRFENGLAVTLLGDFPVDTCSNAVLVHPDGLRLAEPDSDGGLSGRVVACRFQGQFYEVSVEVAPDTVFSLSVSANSFALSCAGDAISIYIDHEAVHGLAD
jgi:ABC-type Fe3+/spermidine/putrescine transport system ATPase subunit